MLPRATNCPPLPKYMSGRLVLNLLKFRDNIRVLHKFLTFSVFLLYLSRMWIVETANVQCDNVKPFSSGGLTLSTTHFASINHITAVRILNFILRAKDFYLLL